MHTCTEDHSCFHRTEYLYKYSRVQGLEYKYKYKYTPSRRRGATNIMSRNSQNISLLSRTENVCMYIGSTSVRSSTYSLLSIDSVYSTGTSLKFSILSSRLKTIIYRILQYTPLFLQPSSLRSGPYAFYFSST